MSTEKTTDVLLDQIKDNLEIVHKAIKDGYMLTKEQWDMLAAFGPLFERFRRHDIKYSIDVLKTPATPLMRRWGISAARVSQIYHEKD